MKKTLEERKERRRKWLVGLGIVIGLGSMITSAVLVIVLLVTTSNYHSETSQANRAQDQKLEAIHKLQVQANKADKVIEGLPAADAELGQFAIYSIEVNEALCADIRVVAAATGITLSPCPTVPNFASLGK